MRKFMRVILSVLCCVAFFAVWALAEEFPVSPTKVSLPKTAIVMRNRTVTLTPVLYPATATSTFLWSSNKKSVATVSDGIVTGIKPGKAVITVRTANGKKATCTVTVTQIAMTGFSVSVTDYQGDDCYDDEDECFWEVTGHRLYTTIGETSPDDANQTIIWKSTNSKVASVNSKGIIECKKSGTAIVTATSKYGGYQVVLPIRVYSNSTYYDVNECFDDPDDYDEDYYYTSAKRIYIKDRHLYIDMYVLNMNDFTIRRMSNQAIYFTPNYSEAESDDDYAYVGSYKPTLKGQIRPYSIGTITFKLGKINGAKVWLTDADAYCAGYCYSKSLGVMPKGIVPSIAGTSKPARFEK